MADFRQNAQNPVTDLSKKEYVAVSKNHARDGVIAGAAVEMQIDSLSYYD